MKAEEIIAKLSEIFDGDFKKLPWESSTDEEWEAFEKLSNELGGCDIVCWDSRQVQNEDIAEHVLHFKGPDVYIAMHGYYNSWSGTQWENEMFEVFPEEYKRTIYKKKK